MDVKSLNVKYPLFCRILRDLEFSGHIYEKNSSIKFCKNPFSESRVVPCRPTDMSKLTVDFRNFFQTRLNMIFGAFTLVVFSVSSF